jgi:elongator complex protein 1
LILMTRDFDIVSEFPLIYQEKGKQWSVHFTCVDAFVNVGWGKKETQFHGTEGKSAALNVSKVH